MPIGVPRIIYCWGEELPAQWTDIYNFIFRRRMVFLMQYLDDELCNQICGLLINIHMEDRSKELEKKEMERSGVFKNSANSATSFSGAKGAGTGLKSKNTLSSRDSLGNQKEIDLTGAVDSSGVLNSSYNKKARSMEDLLNADEDLGIDEIDTLEQYTLQKITTEWLNWNAQFFDYSDEPYLYYLADLLSKDFNKSQNNISTNASKSGMPGIWQLSESDQTLVTPEVTTRVVGAEKAGKDAKGQKKASAPPTEVSKLLNILKNQNESLSDSVSAPLGKTNPLGGDANPSAQRARYLVPKAGGGGKENSMPFSLSMATPKTKTGVASQAETSNNKANMQMGEVYSAFRTNTNVSFANSLKPGILLTNNKKQKLLKMFQQYQNVSNIFSSLRSEKESSSASKETIFNLLCKLAQKTGDSKPQSYGLASSTAKQNFEKPSNAFLFSSTKSDLAISEKILSQKNLRRAFSKENNFSAHSAANSALLGMDKYSLSNYGKSFNYVNTGNKQNVQSEFRDYYRKQTERALIEEESKKVFVIINSFGGSVGNGITVHDALQFIKAGSLTLALGVAASAASLALAGGTIGERYVTEGCHVMIHQPESSLQGQASDIWIDSQEIMKIRLDVAEIYSLSTYRPRHKILRDLDRDFYLTATETIQYGLADEIASNDVMHDIIEMTNKVWDYHDSKQQRLLESRESASSGLDTQTQN